MNELVSKGILKILKKRGLWLAKGLNLSCLKPKYFNYQVSGEYKICVQGYKYDIYKEFQ